MLTARERRHARSPSKGPLLHAHAQQQQPFKHMTHTAEKHDTHSMNGTGTEACLVQQDHATKGRKVPPASGLREQEPQNLSLATQHKMQATQREGPSMHICPKGAMSNVLCAKAHQAWRWVLSTYAAQRQASLAVRRLQITSQKPAITNTRCMC